MTTARAGLRALRRSEIIAAARTIVAQESLAALTISALEDRLDFTRGVITYHFRNKDEIVLAVLESAIEEIDIAAREGVSAQMTVTEKVSAVVGAIVRGFLEKHEATQILVGYWGRVRTDPKLAQLNSLLFARYRRDSAELLRMGHAIGEFRETNFDALAAVMVGVVIGIVTQSIFEPGSVDVDAAIHEASEAILSRLL